MHDVLRASEKYYAFESFDTPEVQLMDKYGFDIVLTEMARLIQDGYLEMDRIRRTAWPTEKGRAWLKAHGN